MNDVSRTVRFQTLGILSKETCSEEGKNIGRTLKNYPIVWYETTAGERREGLTLNGVTSVNGGLALVGSETALLDEISQFCALLARNFFRAFKCFSEAELLSGY